MSTNETTLAAEGTYTEDYVRALKEKLEAADAEKARLSTRINGFEVQEREEMKQMNLLAKSGMEHLLSTVGDNVKARSDFEKVMAWSERAHEMDDLETQRPMQRTVYAFSAAIEENKKRLRDHDDLSKSVKELHQQNDELQDKYEKAQKRGDELQALSEERYQQLQDMIANLEKAKVVKEKFDFSIASNRESAAPNSSAADSTRSSKNAYNELSKFVMAEGSGSRRVTQNASGHQLLGGNEQSIASQLATAARGMS